VTAIDAYLELGLRLGRHVDGLVDAYYGPAEIADAVSRESLRPPSELVSDAVALRASFASAALDPSRHRWLDAQLVGLETVARKLAGEEFVFTEEVERCYGVRPRRTPESVFESAHEALDELLPGGGSLVERHVAWRERDPLEGELLQGVVESLAAELRALTAERLGLPDGESVQWEYVTDEPWAAYNYYLGGLRSRIAINLDLPVARSFVAELVSHEAYPGHHVEHAWKEQVLVGERGWLEESLLMIGTPQSLVSEGVAQLGASLLLGDRLEELVERRLRDVGVEYDGARAGRIREARKGLAAVPGNAALLLHEDGATEDEAFDYLVRWSLISAQRARAVLRFLTDPLWRSYITTYADGERVCGAWVGDDLSRFRRLLTEQLSPAGLAGVAS
jgi:hypothetical protein